MPRPAEREPIDVLNVGLHYHKMAIPSFRIFVARIWHTRVGIDARLRIGDLAAWNEVCAEISFGESW